MTKIDFDTVTNDAAEGVPYFTPKQPSVIGSVRSTTANPPGLFTPLKIKNLTIPNRIGVSPMCMYSADQGKATPFHMVHYGALAARGPGLIIMESVAVQDEGRISPNCLGTYTDEQVSKLKEIVQWVHSQGKTIGVQLNHAGMKGSTLPLYYGAFDHRATAEQGGNLDNVWGISKNEDFDYAKVCSTEQLYQVADNFGKAVEKAIGECGFDFVEIHAAHGYFCAQLLSPLINKRTDEFGGSFENRTRFLLEVLKRIKAFKTESKKEFPVFMRLNGSDNDESNPDSWRFEDALKLVPILVENGVHLIDISSGGNCTPHSPIISHAEMTKQVKAKVGNTALVAAGGGIATPQQANKMIEDGECDLCLLGIPFLKNVCTVEQWADEMGVDIQMQVQVGWPFGKVW